MKMRYDDRNREQEKEARTSLRDLNSGEMVEVDSPGSFELETVLLDSAYYKYRGKEFRFLLSQARVLGLKIA